MDIKQCRLFVAAPVVADPGYRLSATDCFPGDTVDQFNNPAPGGMIDLTLTFKGGSSVYSYSLICLPFPQAHLTNTGTKIFECKNSNGTHSIVLETQVS